MEASHALLFNSVCTGSFYLCYVINITLRRLMSINALPVDDLGVLLFRLQVSDRLTINSTSLLTGFSMFCTQLSSLVFYAMSSETTKFELVNVTWNSRVSGCHGLPPGRKARITAPPQHYRDPSTIRAVPPVGSRHRRKLSILHARSLPIGRSCDSKL